MLEIVVLESIMSKHKRKLSIELSSEQKEFVISALDENTKILKSEYFDNYNLPCPINILTETNGIKNNYVLRLSRHTDLVLEAYVLRLLKDCKLPAPEIIATKDGEYNLITYLPGERLQSYSELGPEQLNKAKDLVLNAISQLHKETDNVRALDTQSKIPDVNLYQYLEDLQGNGFDKYIIILQRKLDISSLTTVFTNGDYQPGNFLTDGSTITGFLDFETSSFQDPLLGIAKYELYDLHPLSKTNLITQYCTIYNFTKSDYLIRLAAFAIERIINEEDKTSEYCRSLIKKLDSTIDKLSGI